MDSILILLMVISCCLSSASAALVLLERSGDRMYKARERAAEKAMEEEELRRSREMEEGVDNLMRFAVNGHDGFGGAL